MLSDDVILKIYSFIPIINEENSRTFLTLFHLSKSLNKSGNKIYPNEKEKSIVWLLPSCYWSIGINSESIKSLLWGFGEFEIRFGSGWDSLHTRCIGGLRALYFQGHLRNVKTSHDGKDGIFLKVMGGSLDLKDRFGMILKSHDKEILEWDLIQVCNKAAESTEYGKYSRWWNYKKSILMVKHLIYVVGQMIKEEWDENITERQRGMILDVVNHKNDSKLNKELQDVIEKDFERSLKIAKMEVKKQK